LTQEDVLEKPLPVVGERRVAGALVRYLFLPRVAEVGKWVFLPSGIVVGALSTSDRMTWSSWDVVLFFVAFEFLLYQARYMWNDLRDFERDLLHPGASIRRRIPGPLSASRERAAQVTAGLVARIAIASAIFFILPDRLGTALACSGAAIFLLGFVYEYIKDRTRESDALFLGRPRAEALTGITRLTPSKLALCLWVGTGYSLRIATGVWVGAGGDPTLIGILVVAALGFFFGVMFVTMTWALEGTGYLARCSYDDLAVSLCSKGYLAPFLRQSGALARTNMAELPDPSVARQGILFRTGAAGSAIWRWSFLASVTASMLAGYSLVTDLGEPSRVMIAASVSTAILATPLVLRFRSCLVELGLTVASSAVLGVVVTREQGFDVLAFTPILFASSGYFSFLFHSYGNFAVGYGRPTGRPGMSRNQGSREEKASDVAAAARPSPSASPTNQEVTSRCSVR
jgi:hypothetical protein